MFNHQRSKIQISLQLPPHSTPNIGYSHGQKKEVELQFFVWFYALQMITFKIFIHSSKLSDLAKKKQSRIQFDRAYAWSCSTFSSTYIYNLFKKTCIKEITYTENYFNYFCKTLMWKKYLVVIWSLTLLCRQWKNE